MKTKKRHNPDKNQNNYGSNYECLNYDTLENGVEFCHDEGNVTINGERPSNWAKVKNNKLVCKGNRHNCMKLYLKWKASTKNN